jgi:hypothetical protein
MPLISSCDQVARPAAFVTGPSVDLNRLDDLLATQAFPLSRTETLAYDASRRPLSEHVVAISRSLFRNVTRSATSYGSRANESRKSVAIASWAVTSVPLTDHSQARVSRITILKT